MNYSSFAAKFKLSWTPHLLSAPNLKLQILSSLPSKRIQNRTTSHRLHCTHPGPGPQHCSCVSTLTSLLLHFLGTASPSEPGHVPPLLNTLQRPLFTKICPPPQSFLRPDLLLYSKYSVPNSLASLLEHVRHAPASGPLHWLLPSSGMFCAMIALWLTPLPLPPHLKEAHSDHPIEKGNPLALIPLSLFFLFSQNLSSSNMAYNFSCLHPSCSPPMHVTWVLTQGRERGLCVSNSLTYPVMDP